MRVSCLESQKGICELSCSYLAPAVKAKTLGMGFPPSLGFENLIIFSLVRSPNPCIARATQVILKSVGSKEELSCGGISEGRVRNKERNLGKWNHEKSGKSLKSKSIQLKQRVFMWSARHLFPGEVSFKTSSRRAQYILAMSDPFFTWRQSGYLGFCHGSFPLSFPERVC